MVGSKSMAIYDDLDQEEPLRILERTIKKIPYYKSYGEFKMLYKFGDIYSPRIPPQEPLYVECAHFIECILNNKRPLTSAQQGLEVVRIIEFINRSLKSKGKTIKIGEE